MGDKLFERVGKYIVKFYFLHTFHSEDIQLICVYISIHGGIAFWVLDTNRLCNKLDILKSKF